MRELAELEVDQDEATEQPVVENEIDVEVIAFERHALLSRDEAEALAELEQELLDAVDDGLLELTFAPLGALTKPEELEHERILEDIGWPVELVSAPGKRQDLVLVAALGEALEQERRGLPLELAAGPALARRLDLVVERRSPDPPWRRGASRAGR